MRPIVKGTAAAAGYNPPATLTWTSRMAAYAAAKRVFGISSPPVTVPLTTALAKWVEWFDDDDQDLEKVVSSIMKMVNGIYKAASVPLTTTIGAFCSYCETPVSGLLEVEHAANKSNYPTFSCDWNNFLLSCSACNTKKLDKPDRLSVRTWSPRRASLTEQEYYDRIRARYAFPDTYNDTFQAYPHNLWYQEGSTLYPVALPDAVDENNVIVSQDMETREVRANIRVGSTFKKNKIVRVEIDPRDPSRALELTNLCALNTDGTSGTYDRRVFNRTVAWFNILQLLKPLRAAATQQDFDSLWPVVPLASVYIGFWSVWVNILSQFSDPSRRPVVRTFINDANRQYLSPGTNVTNIVTP